MVHESLAVLFVLLGYTLMYKDVTIFFVNLLMSVLLYPLMIWTAHIDSPYSEYVTPMCLQGFFLGHKLRKNVQWPQISLTILTIILYCQTNFNEYNPFWFIVRVESLQILSRTRHKVLTKISHVLQLILLYVPLALYLWFLEGDVPLLLYAFMWMPWQASHIYSELTDNKKDR